MPPDSQSYGPRTGEGMAPPPAGPAQNMIPQEPGKEGEANPLGRARVYRVVLPTGYEKSRQRYPVVYWLHGSQEPPIREKRLADYVATHELILVDAGPSDAQSQFALYFPELIDQIDKTLRTVAECEHVPATSGDAER